MIKFLPNPWFILIFLGILLGSNGLTWWKTRGYAERQCVARVQLANATLQAAKDRLAREISSKSFALAMDRSRAARVADRAYGDLLVMIGEQAVMSCEMPQQWWNKVHEIR